MSTNANWHCGNYYWHKLSRNVNFKVCLVSNGHATQAVMVVQNKASVSVRINGESQITTNFGGDQGCQEHVLEAGQTRGCYGPTVEGVTTGAGADGWLRVNYVGERWSEAMARQT
ncbi:hypothetical protein [Streptomyces avermitilis]|uniref:hypothetical protein n=1 Tax=Streptomyces avermitilis TaxID=33903 RepID=UPI0033F798D8